MKLSLTTLLMLRRAALALVAAIEEAAREAYGWTPQRVRAPLDEMQYTRDS